MVRCLLGVLLLLCLYRSAQCSNDTELEVMDEEEIETKVREYHINQIKARILAQMGWDKPPEVDRTHAPTMDSQKEEEYNLLSYLQSAEVHSNSPPVPSVLTLHSFKGTVETVEDHPITAAKLQQCYSVYFSFEWPQVGEIQRIELLLYHTTTQVEDRINPTIIISELQDRNCTEPMKIPITTATITRQNGYGKYDITGNMGNWLKKKHMSGNNVTVDLDVTVYRVGTSTEDSMQTQIKANTNNTFELPRLILFLKKPELSSKGEGQQARKRREADYMDTIEPTYCRNNETSCCLKELTLNFSEIGLDFISKPETVDFGYCQGTCQVGDLQGTPSYYNFIMPENSHIQPCCAVNSTKPLVFTDTNGTTFKMENVLPLDCQCR